MAALRRRTMVLAAIVLPVIALTAWLVMSQTRAMRVSDLARRAIPASLTQEGHVWTSSEMEFSELEMQVLETRDYVYRTYSDGRGSPVDLCVIFSEDNRKGTHPPDVCVEGSGSKILTRSERPAEMAGTPLVMRELVVTNPAGQYVYFAYFYKCGDVFTPSFYQQQVQIIWNGLTRRNSSGALIRLSTPVAGTASASDVDAARQRVDLLLSAAFPSLRDGLNEPR